MTGLIATKHQMQVLLVIGQLAAVIVDAAETPTATVLSAAPARGTRTQRQPLALALASAALKQEAAKCATRGTLD